MNLNKFVKGKISIKKRLSKILIQSLALMLLQKSFIIQSHKIFYPN